MLGRNHKKHIS